MEILKETANNGTTWLIVNMLLGLCVGSFLNVCIYRWPRGLSLLTSSACPKSGNKILWYDNIPLLSFILLGGKGRTSGEPISIIYPIVESITAIGFALNSIIIHGPGLLIAHLLLCAMIVGTVTDAKHMIIPNQISFGLPIIITIWQGLNPEIIKITSRMSTSTGTAFTDGVLTTLTGACAGAGIMIILGIVGAELFKKEAMGMGDIKLAIGIGALYGLPGTTDAIVLGGIIFILMIPILKRVEQIDLTPEDPTPHGAIPFGPALLIITYMKWMIPTLTLANLQKEINLIISKIL